MALLDHNEVHAFWRDYQDPYIYRVIAFMESHENWTADGQHSFEDSLTRLGDTLAAMSNIEISEENNLVLLCCAIRTGRYLRLLMALDNAYPGAAAKILQHAEQTTESDEDTAGMFLKRNIVFERLRLLGRIFSKQRTDLILNALEDN